VEDAVCILADAIGAAAPGLVQGDNEKDLRLTVGALASIMVNVVSARAIVATAHRSFCEGDKLSAEGKLQHAQAERAARGLVARAQQSGALNRVPVLAGNADNPTTRTYVFRCKPYNQVPMKLGQSQFRSVPA
jgi:hypothetical protein